MTYKPGWSTLPGIHNAASAGTNSQRDFLITRVANKTTWISPAGVEIVNANGADSAQFAPGEGRSVYAGLEVKW
ncbi:hypothetical protein [Limnobacter sp.]|uniref:hypothetical protein n=1 Tax=Limnobacter sp. TaxID=2003368 RepID=UPI002733EDDF|nr:hypothetical protein [Limnobacter sp.]MDP3188360.1 hypothetical protein [Limnobacter sp.]